MQDSKAIRKSKVFIVGFNIYVLVLENDGKMGQGGLNINKVSMVISMIIFLSYGKFPAAQHSDHLKLPSPAQIENIETRQARTTKLGYLE